jgi:dTDP-4-dehydrorhamnose 3,5-epimerase
VSRIDGLRVTPLCRIPDERGAVLHMLRADNEGFEGFGEIYFSMVYPGAIKAWHTGELSYSLVTIPPFVWNGFKGEGSAPALVANCATVPHHPDEIVRRDPFSSDIPYDWALRHG